MVIIVSKPTALLMTFGKGRRAPVVLFEGRGMFRNNQKSPYRK